MSPKIKPDYKECFIDTLIRTHLDEMVTTARLLVKGDTSDKIKKAVDFLYEAWLADKTIVTVGNGGSALSADHFAGDVAKYAFSLEGIPIENKRSKAICLNWNINSLTAWINDVSDGWDRVWLELLRPWAQPGNVFVIFSVGGGGKLSKNLNWAMEHAIEKGMKLISFVGKTGGRAKELADKHPGQAVSLVVPTPTGSSSRATPRTEGWNDVLNHIVIDVLREKIVEGHQLQEKSKQSGVFLDRDGVINELIWKTWPGTFEEKGLYDSPTRPAEFKLITDAGEAIRELNNSKIPVIIISKQPGLAKGKYMVSHFEKITQKMHKELAKKGAIVDGEYYCHHHPDPKQVVVAELLVKCSCRKPAPGLILRAAREHNLNLKKSFMIGDDLKEVETGLNAGCRTILIENEQTKKWNTKRELERAKVKPNYKVRSLKEAVEIIKKHFNEAPTG